MLNLNDYTGSQSFETKARGSDYSDRLKVVRARALVVCLSSLLC